MTQPHVAEPRVAVFFYGSFMNRRVLAEADFAPDRMEVAVLDGWDITIGPLTNLLPSKGRRVHGALTWATHAQLDRLYAHARTKLGAVFLPHPVVVTTSAGDQVPALCYINPDMTKGAASADYVERIAGSAEELGLPASYIAHLRSFAR